MARAKFKVGDHVKIVEEFHDYVDEDDPLLDTPDKVQEAVFVIRSKTPTYSGDSYYYEIVHENEPRPDAECFEVDEYVLDKYIVKPPTKAEMAEVYKLLGVSP